MSKQLTIALIQMNSSSNLEKNLQQASQWLVKAKGQGADLAVLPESFAMMEKYEKQKLQITEQQGQGVIQQWLATTSRQLGLWIVGGTIAIDSEIVDRPFARCLVYNELGQLVCHYDKIHLFDVKVNEQEQYSESATTAAGDKDQVFTIKGIKVGLSVCYDLRFPELYRRYQQQAVELLLVPSAFTHKTGQAHWQLLNQARAVENLAFVVAVNQTGTHDNKRQTYGHSLVIDPWGTVVQSMSEEPGFIVETIDCSKIEKIKKKFPVHLHRVL